MKSINVMMAPVEQVTRTWQKVVPAKMEGEDAGEMNEWTYAGSWEALQGYAEEFLSSRGSETCQARASLRREAGGMAVLTVSTQLYTLPGADEEDGGSSGGGGDETEDDDVVEVSYEVSGAAEDILTHPRFKDVKWESDAGVALALVARGARVTEMFEGEAGGLVKVLDAVKEIKGWEIVQRAGSFYVPRVTATVSEPGGSGSLPTAGTIGGHSALKAPRGHNWLSLGGSVQIVNGKKRTVSKYVMSGPTGWDSEIYQ